MIAPKPKLEPRNVSLKIGGVWRDFRGVTYRIHDSILHITVPGRCIYLFPLEILDEAMIPLHGERADYVETFTA